MTARSSMGRGAVSTSCLIASTGLLGWAVQVADGFYHPRALALLSGAFLLAAVGLSLRQAGAASAGHARVVRVALAATITLQVLALLAKPPGMYLRAGARVDLFSAGVIVQALAVAAGAFSVRRLARVWFPVVLGLSLALGTWMLEASPDPQIDVVEVHETALAALAHGRNPYKVTFRNIYGDTRFYNPQAVAGDQVLFGYPYPPLSLLLAAPGQTALGDYRYAELAAAVGAAALMGYGVGSLTAKLAATLWLTTPRLYFVLEQGWTEPIAVLMLALTVFCMVRGPAWAPWSTGLLLVTKQYVAVAAPLAWRVSAAWPGGSPASTWRAVLAGSLVTLPFVAWDVRAFVDTVVLLQTKEPFRIDSLSYASWAARAGWGEASWLWAAGAGIVVLVAAFRRADRTATGFSGAIAVTTLAMFSMGSKAFCNYYVFVIGALSCAIASCEHPPADHAPGPDRAGNAGSSRRA